jgi:hypothetical protein
MSGRLRQFETRKLDRLGDSASDNLKAGALVCLSTRSKKRRGAPRSRALGPRSLSIANTSCMSRPSGKQLLSCCGRRATSTLCSRSCRPRAEAGPVTMTGKFACLQSAVARASGLRYSLIPAPSASRSGAKAQFTKSVASAMLTLADAQDATVRGRAGPPTSRGLAREFADRPESKTAVHLSTRTTVSRMRAPPSARTESVLNPTRVNVSFKARRFLEFEAP